MRGPLYSHAAIVFLASLAAACGSKTKEAEGTPEQAVTPAAASTSSAPVQTPAAVPRRDPFTYSNYEEVAVKDLALDISVDFGSKTINGVATLTIDRIVPSAAALVLDTNDLDIRSVEAGDGAGWAPTTFKLGADDKVLGSKLEIALPAGARKVKIAYVTSPTAEGLQWLTAEQTAGGVSPFMYSQNQAINARSMAPVQDTPAVRMTYSAIVRTPPELLAVMSAEQDSGPRDGEYAFRMPQPVPAYLLAIAVGDLAFRKISDTIGVYAETEIVEAAATEFSDTPAMEKAMSALYGPYRWGRYDLLVLPPSFPFGGMENPRLSFLTPTLIAGDKSLTGTVAHELAHSWSGNLVTNRTWSDAWLNEGVTSYVESRVSEAVYGADRAAMEQKLTMDDLVKEIAELDSTEMSKLQLPIALEHPDDAFSAVAYDKGRFFLQFLEQRYGRDRFDPFLKSYFDAFAFRTVTTADFREFLMSGLVNPNPGKATIKEIDEWLYGEGLPNTAPKASSAAFDRIEKVQTDWLGGKATVSSIYPRGWTTQEWLHFINKLPETVTAEQLKELDMAFDLSNTRNAEVAFAFYMKAIDAHYAPAQPSIEAFLTRVGRGKFLYPIYEALKENGELAFAERIFEKARPGYHPIAQRRVSEILQGQN